MKKKRKKKRKEMRTYRFLFSTESQVFSTPQKVANLSKHGAYIEFFLGKIPLCPQKALNKEGKKGKKGEKKIKEKSTRRREVRMAMCQNWHQCQKYNAKNPMPKLAPMPKLESMPKSNANFPARP